MASNQLFVKHRSNCITRLRRVLVAAIVLSMPLMARSANELEDVLSNSGVKGGLVAHIGCGDGKLTAKLRLDDRYLVHGLDTNAENVETARSRIKELGSYGKVSIDSFDGKNLPYIDNVVNLLVAESLGSVSLKEVKRVLAPGGIAIIGQGDKRKRIVKPVPGKTDEWTHYLHGPDNNAVSRDKAVSHPYHIQWVGLPKWTRNHNHLNSYSAVVSSSGRIFYIVDEAPAHSIQYPAKWNLVARDAYNGVVLWRKQIGPWEGHLRRFRSGPAELPRRLVAAGDRVYVTLGYDRPVSALDAASGEVIRVYKGTEGTHEIVYSEGTLYLVAGEINTNEYKESLRAASPSPAIRKKRILAVDAETGESVWAKSDSDTDEMLPTTLCVDKKKVFFNSPNELVCLDRKSGEIEWKVPRPVEHNRLGWSAPTLVVYKGVVLSAEGKHGGSKGSSKTRKKAGDDKGENAAKTAAESSSIKWTVTSSAGSTEGGELIAFRVRDGEELWRCDAAFGYSSPPDVFVADGLVWVSTEPGMNVTDVTLGRDLLTGEVKRRIDTAEAFDAAHHHRCYRDRATNDFLLLGRTGVEFVDLTSKEIQRHYWIRGTCQYGLMPANGLIYLPGHSCGCYIQSKLNGFWALAPKRGAGEISVQEDNRLERGPAFGTASEAGQTAASDWPMLRYNAARSSSSEAVVPRNLKPRWKTELKGTPSSPVISGNRLVAALSESHSVAAIDTDSGTVVWRYTTGGRIDSPPALYGNMAIFGSHDGHVYCLRLSDGQLAWRFRAAPTDRRTVVFGQVESVWPVVGSVLTYEDSIYCTAGRTSYLDGGITLFRLDPQTGKELARNQLYSRDPETGKQPDSLLEDVELPGALPDIFTVENRNIFLRDIKLDANLKEDKGTYLPHLYSSAGLLEGAWWHRTYWIWGERAFGRASGWAIAGRYRPSGQIFALDGSVLYGYKFGPRAPGKADGSTGGTHTLFCADKKVQKVDRELKNNNEAVIKHMTPDKVVINWSKNIDLCARAMAKAADTIFIAGPQTKDEIYFDDENVPASLAAFDTKSGEPLSRIKIDCQPVFDGMAAANGELYISAIDGSITCFSEVEE